MNLAFWLGYIVRSFRRGGRRTVFALLCVGLGVGAVVALQLAAVNIRASLTSDVRASNGGDISLSSETTPLSAVDLALFRRLAASGRISAWTAVAGFHATAVSTSHLLVPFEVSAVSAPPYPLGGQPTFVAPTTGRVAALLARPGDVLVTSTLASELGASVGTRLAVSGVGGPGLIAIVTGIVGDSNFQQAATMTIAVRDASRLTSAARQYTAVYINAPAPAVPGVAALLRSRFPTATVQTVQAALKADEQQVHDFSQFTLLIGLLALAIAGIGILNAMQSLLAWRRLEIAMLKAIGFGQPSLYVLFGGEALLIGFVGGIAGSALGALLGEVITSTLAASAALQVRFQLDIGTLFAGVALGVIATLVFAVIPIARAAGLRPLEMLRPGGENRLTGRLPQTFLLLLLVVCLFAALAGAIIGDLTLSFQFTVGAFLIAGFLALLFSGVVAGLSRLGPPRSRAVAAGVLLVLAGATAVAAIRLPAVAAILALAALLWAVTIVLPVERLFPLLIAVRSLGRRRARTSITLVAFLVGVLAMSLTLTVALSLQSQIATALSAARANNMVAIADTAGASAVVHTAARLPGVRHFSAVLTDTTRPLAVNGRSLSGIISTVPGADAEDLPARQLSGISGYDLRAGVVPAGITIVAGRPLFPSDAGTDHVLVARSLEDGPFSLRPGERVTVRDSSTGTIRTLRVVGFYARPRGLRRGFASFFTPPVYGDRSLVAALAGSNVQTVVSFTVLPGNLAHDATVLQRAVPAALVLNINDLTAVVQQILSDLLNVLLVITALALGAGLSVVGNGVTLAMLERYREIAVYKAIGFEPRDVLRFVLLENGLTGLIAGTVSVVLVAIALAALSHFALQTAIGFDPVLAVLVLIGAALLAVGVAYLSARRPVEIRPLEALRNE